MYNILYYQVGRGQTRYHHRKEIIIMATNDDQTLTTKESLASAETTIDTSVSAPVSPNFAKSGKKSKKHIEAVQAEAERQARKAERIVADHAPIKPKGEHPAIRPKIERRGKNYRASAQKIQPNQTYNLEQAIKLALETQTAKFDATLEIHTRLNVDPRQADQNIRTTFVLPHGNGKTVRVAVFAPLDICKIAKNAGADIAEDEVFLQQLEKGIVDFDILIATPAYMPKLGKFARLLGPKGLMPNPKAGTVTNDIEKAVKEAKAGKIEYRVDKQGIVHIGFGKVSFGAKKLLDNATTFLKNLQAQKPNSIKGAFIKSIFITTTMGPSIPVENIYN